MSAVEQLEKDLEEVKKFIGEASRPRVRDMLEIDLHKLENQLKVKMSECENGKLDTSTAGTPTVQSRDKIFTEQIKNYAWDQSDKFMKLYISMNGVQSIPAENITSHFTDKSVELKVKNVNNKNFELLITKVCETIDPSASYHKIKSDTVLLMLKKKETGKTWGYVTEAEKKAKESKKTPAAALDEKDDPNASIMKMMQNMYDEGDDEMKRTISKAWSESRDKQPSF